MDPEGNNMRRKRDGIKGKKPAGKNEEREERNRQRDVAAAGLLFLQSILYILYHSPSFPVNRFCIRHHH